MWRIVGGFGAFLYAILARIGAFLCGILGIIIVGYWYLCGIFSGIGIYTAYSRVLVFMRHILGYWCVLICHIGAFWFGYWCVLMWYIWY